MKYKVLKTLKMQNSEGKIIDHQPGEFIEGFNNASLYTELGYIVPVVFAVEAPVEDAPVEDAPVEYTQVPYHGFTRKDLEDAYKADLKELAKELGIDPMQSKADLIDQILAKA